MKRFIIALAALLTMAINAEAMSYEQARREALFLTDKMAYELNLSEDQYEAAYEVNLDYLLSIDTSDDLYGVYWTRRNLDLSYILFDWQYSTFCAATYFYRPLYWNAGYWHLGIYARYPRRTYFYYGYPDFWYTYRGGHSWRYNGGRSWYRGRNWGRSHGYGRGGGWRGMRDGFDRGDYRNRRPDGYSGRGRGNGNSGHNGNFGNRRDFGDRRDFGNNRDRGKFNNGGTGRLDPNRSVDISNRIRLDDNSEKSRQDRFSTRTRSEGTMSRRRPESDTYRRSSTRSTVTRSNGAFERSNNDRVTTTRKPSSTFTPSRRSSSFERSDRSSTRSSTTFSRPNGSSTRSSGTFSSGSRGGGSRGGGGHFGGRR